MKMGEKEVEGCWEPCPVRLEPSAVASNTAPPNLQTCRTARRTYPGMVDGLPHQTCWSAAPLPGQPSWWAGLSSASGAACETLRQACRT